MATAMETELNGQKLKKAFKEAEVYIEQHVDEVNALNVFPVPDGDTGINMFLTMKSAIEAAERADSSSAGIVAASAAKEERRVYGFDVQFLLEGKALPVEEIRNRVIASGECPLVVGDEKLLKAHVHTMNPDEILDYARSKGTLSDIVIEDMDQQVQKQAREGKRPRQQ